MFVLISYSILILLELIFAISLCIYTLSLFWSSIMGSPYVPTKKKELINFLKEARIKKGQIFLELGCGDGRVVKTAVKEYAAKGIGIDINPTLIFWAKFIAKLTKVSGIEFKVQNIFKTDVSKADFIYLFLMPKLLEKLKTKFEEESKKNAVIISHGFKILGWEKYNYKTIVNKPFPTYYYKLRS
ncbi:MAG: methyltransferase domain-containing protein [Candidatus Roizmanbacteria bacterium]|nr:MAG: methyltransferase domain-containing protein [Candidatus Roizmanbacteria bacterium]